LPQEPEVMVLFFDNPPNDVGSFVLQTEWDMGNEQNCETVAGNSQ